MVFTIAERDSHLADKFCGAGGVLPRGLVPVLCSTLQRCLRRQFLPLDAVVTQPEWLLFPAPDFRRAPFCFFQPASWLCQPQPGLGFGAVSSFIAAYLFTRRMILKIMMTQGHQAWTQTDESVHPNRGYILLFRAQVLLIDRCGLQFWLFFAASFLFLLWKLGQDTCFAKPQFPHL